MSSSLYEASAWFSTGLGDDHTHDAQLAAWADRVVFLRDGRMIDQTDANPAIPHGLLASGPR